MEQSPFLLIKRLETLLKNTLSPIDLLDLTLVEQKLIANLKSEIIDARLDIRDYELSETRAEQLTKAEAARVRIDVVRKQILAASEYNIFGAVDVAQLSAQLEQIHGRLL